MFLEPFSHLEKTVQKLNSNLATKQGKFDICWAILITQEGNFINRAEALKWKSYVSLSGSVYGG